MARSAFGSNEPARRPGYRRLRYWADEHDGRGYTRHSKTIKGTKRDGWDELARIRLAHGRDAPCPTVGELWETHERPRLREAVERGELSPRTERIYVETWERYVAPDWADVPATDVRPMALQGWLLARTRSVGKISRVVLRLTLDHAVMLELVDSNPAAKRYRLGEDSRRDEGAYSPVELDQLWDVVRGSACEVPFLLSAHAGLRVGEACAVRREDVTWREDGAAIVRVRVQLTASGVTDRLKTKGSRRAVGLARPWADRLREIYDAQPDCLVYLNDAGDGEPLGRSVVSSAWKRLVSASDVPYRSMQTLRPSFQTTLHWAGVPIEQTSRMLGHASTSMTLANYDRPSEEDVANMMLDAQRSVTRWDTLGRAAS